MNLVSKLFVTGLYLTSPILNLRTTVSAQDVERHGGVTLLRTYGGIAAFLRTFYPDHDWDAYERGKDSTISKAQRRLTHVLQKIFPEADLISNYRHKNMASQEFDVFLPKLNLAFEYQVCII